MDLLYMHQISISIKRHRLTPHTIQPEQFCSFAVLDPRVGYTMEALLHLSLSSVILIDSTTGSPAHVLMLSIQAVRGLSGYVHLALFLALSLSPGTSIVSS